MVDLVGKIKEQIKILSLAKELGAELKRAGTGQYKCKCLLHKEVTASMVIYSTAGRFYCYGCGQKGTVIDLWKEYHRISSQEAIKQLAKKINSGGTYRQKKEVLPEPEQKATIPEPETPQEHIEILTDLVKLARILVQDKINTGLRYLRSRGISKRIIEQAQLGYIHRFNYNGILGHLYSKYGYPKVREVENHIITDGVRANEHFILFPYLQDNEVKAIKIRNMKKSKKERIYRNFGKVKGYFYNVNILQNLKTKKVFLTEGEIKTLALLSNNYQAVGTSGVNNFSDNNIKLFKGLKVIINVDRDKEKHLPMLAERFKKEGIKTYGLILKCDIDDYLKQTSIISRHTIKEL